MRRTLENRLAKLEQLKPSELRPKKRAVPGGLAKIRKIANPRAMMPARSFTLPDTVDPEGVRADYAQGVLTITLAKKELAKPRAIKVNVN